MEGQPNTIFYLALAAYPPVAAVLSWRLGPRRGMMASLLAGWLFLPTFSRPLGPPLLHTKAMFVPVVVLMVTLAFDLRRWIRFRPALLDLPMAVVCLAPAAAALANELGGYEAGSAVLEAFAAWGAPYLLARVYLGRPEAVREFAMAIVLAALVYVPLCLWEIRMSPQLHGTLYGFSAYGMFATVVRWGGYRPSVFMATGLAVGMFMACGALVALWLWRTGAQRTLAGIGFGWVAGLLVVVTLLCKSTGAIALLFLGYGVLEATRWIRKPVLILLLMAIPVAYAASRISGWSGERLVSAVESHISADRAQSIQFRITNEDMLIDKALQSPWLGWGRFGRSRVYDEAGSDVTITDGMWIIKLGVNGFAGLLATWLVLVLPALALLRMFPARQWGDPRLAAAASLAVCLLLWTIDDLLNAMMAPLYPAMSGAVIAFYLFARDTRAMRRAAAQREARIASHGTTWAQGHGS